MKTSLKSLLALAAIGTATWLIAQDNQAPMDGPGGGNGPHGPGMGGHRPPPPIVAVLDANHDGVISADEIANASKALLKLDKNGDGKLTPEELRPPRPEGRGEGRGEGPGPEGFGPEGPGPGGPEFDGPPPQE
ncbi:MAG: hypothetical protein RLY20_1990 [Verrucomicrobiota bacterium]|jgi:hypothetical protein